MDIKDIFIQNSSVCQSTLRRYYREGEYSEYICSICGQEPIWQGKELTLILDHIDGNNTNDVLENLRWVCPNCNQQLETTGSRNARRYDKKYCLDCGKEIHHLSERCKDCHIKYRKDHSGSTIPISREELKSLIRTIPFVKISKQFGVSDKAIVKWCVAYNLPSRKKDIKQFSDKDWDII